MGSGSWLFAEIVDAGGCVTHEDPQRRPSGDVYAWYQRGLDLLRRGDAHAAAQVLSHAHAVEPHAKSIREALARAQFNSRRFAESAETFGTLVAENPADDYAQFGLGLSLARLGHRGRAAGHLAIASAMRPSSESYAAALDEVRTRMADGSDRGRER